MVFNGPFRIKTFNVETGTMTLGRNLGYHQDPESKNYDDEVRANELEAVFSVGNEEVAVSYADLESKTVFFMTDASVADRAQLSKPDVYDDTSVYTYVFNTENPLFADARVRRALSLAIDRNAIASAARLGTAANGFIPDFMGGSPESLINTSADLDAARELLSQVNLAGISKSFTLTVDNTEESRVIAELVAAAWGELGFNVKISYVKPVKSVVQEIQITDSGIQALVKEASYGNRNFDVLAIDWQLYVTDPFVGLASLSTCLGGGGYDVNTNSVRKGISGWYSADYDHLITTAYKSWGQTREDSLLEAEKLLAESLPICPILFNQTLSVEAKEISRVDVDAYGNLILTDMKQKNYKKYLPEE